MNKREFLKISAVAAAGGLVSSTTRAGFASEPKPPITRTLGKTGIELPVISSGSFQSDNMMLAREIFKSGMIHFDSAYIYMNGRNDVLLGKMLKEFGRDKFIISTKIEFPEDNNTGQYKKEATTQAFLEKLNESLSRQGVDFVDILYLHRPSCNGAAMNEEMLNGLRKAKEEGKARFVGLSTHSNQAELLETAIQSKFYEVVLAAYNFRLEDTVGRAIAKAADEGIGIVAMKTLAGNFLDKEKTKPINKSAALKWVLQDKNVHTAILSIHNIEELELYKSLLHNIEMTTQEKEDLNSYKLLAGLYCHGCEKCKPQCPYGLAVPDIMRAYMYAYGYNTPLKAKNVLDLLSQEIDACSKCPECQVQCPNQLNISDRIRDIIRLKDVPSEFLT